MLKVLLDKVAEIDIFYIIYNGKGLGVSVIWDNGKIKYIFRKLWQQWEVDDMLNFLQMNSSEISMYFKALLQWMT